MAEGEQKGLPFRPPASRPPAHAASWFTRARRRRARSRYSGLSSIPSQSRPWRSATTPTVPEPKNGSRTAPARTIGGPMRDADRVEVEVISRAAGEEIDDLISRTEPVGGGLWERVGLRPHDLVPAQPAVVGQRQQQALGSREQSLRRRAPG